jgi:uroporphyrinogen decarboxylase
MRQAGRYLPEFRTMREKHSFAEIIHSPELAATITLQPVKRFGFDAAIVFSDIMAVPEAMGARYELRKGEGIVLEKAVEKHEDAVLLESDGEVLKERLDYVGKALRIVREKLNGETALLGFAGSPWTLACYMAEGGGAKGGCFTKALKMADLDTIAFGLLMTKLTDAVVAHLCLQIEAGADAVQIFDTWAAACPPLRYDELSLKWIGEIVSKLPHDIPVILYAKGKACDARKLAMTGARVISVDQDAILGEIARVLPDTVAVQGNLDPAFLEGNPQIVRNETKSLLESMRLRKGYIVNLGHGITPKARLESVEALAETVQNFV